MAEEPPTLPAVVAKQPQLGEGDTPPVGLGAPGKDGRNAAEIARLSAWATGDCGKPILAD